MTTSANVIEYEIRDKDGKRVGSHRQNLMCKRNTKDLLKFQPASDYTIHPWGYDEEEEMWEGESSKLDEWLKENPNETK